MTRHRGFSVVLQDSHKGLQTKEDVIKHLHLKEPCQAVVAREPYGHQEGYHIHVFYRLPNASDFKSHLKHWALWYTAGRVQCDAMRGTMAQACRYLSQDDTKKDKLCDPDPYYFPTIKIKESPAEYADRWLDSWLLRDIANDTESFAYQWKASMDASKTCVMA